MNDNTEELMALDENYLSSTLIRFFSDEALEKALDLMKDGTKRKFVEKELQRRSEEESSFSDDEWEQFIYDWEQACKKIRGGKRNGRS